MYNPHFMAPPQEAAPPVLELINLAKSYGKVQALADLTLTVREGEVYGFLGRNGAGKSTTIRIIMGITRASAGEVRLLGASGKRDILRLRQQIGYVAQEQNFYGWMNPIQLGRFVRGFYPTWDDDEFGRMLHQLELPTNRKTRTFSGGMKVKLGLALALAHRPRLLVLDEPTAGLDPVARREFLEMVKAQAQATQRTTFFSTHLVDEVEMAAHRVGIVDAGRTFFEGSVDTLRGRVRLLRHHLLDQSEPPPLPPFMVNPYYGDQLGYRVLRDGVVGSERRVVVEADPQYFEALSYIDSGWSMEQLPLEEVFIEMVRRPWGAG